MTNLEPWLKRACARYGIREIPAEGVSNKDSFNRAEHVGERRDDQDLDFVCVRPFGRLGNNLIQMASALCFAERAGVPEIRHDFAFLEDRFESDAGVRVVRSHDPAEGGGQGLRHLFFYPEYVDALTDAHPGEFCAQFAGPLRRAFRIRPVIRPSRRVVAHLRGGDIFRTDLPAPPNPNFVQPPLAYYQMAIRAALADGGFDMVHVVAEDLRNPAVLPLVEWLARGGIPFEFTSTDRDADAALIMGGDALIMGYSSFSEILALISETISSVTLFRTSQRTGWLQTKFPDLAVIDCGDADYIEPGRWKCSAEQIGLILDYPEERLFYRSSGSETGASQGS